MEGALEVRVLRGSLRVELGHGGIGTSQGIRRHEQSSSHPSVPCTLYVSMIHGVASTDVYHSPCHVKAITQVGVPSCVYLRISLGKVGLTIPR